MSGPQTEVLNGDINLGIPMCSNYHYITNHPNLVGKEESFYYAHLFYESSIQKWHSKGGLFLCHGVQATAGKT